MDECWPDDDEDKPAPSPLRRVQALVNTVERPDGDDRLADPSQARGWLRDHGLLGPRAEVATGDVETVVEVREALRALLVHNAGGPAPMPDHLIALRQLTAPLRTTVDDLGGIEIVAGGDDVRSRLAALLTVVRDAQRDGTWQRLKACGNDECRWAFYDASRNRGGTWCDMSGCGNRMKNRQFRARRRSAAGR